MPKLKNTEPEVKIGARVPRALVDLIDLRADELSRLRGSKVNRSTALREVLFSALAPKQAA